MGIIRARITSRSHESWLLRPMKFVQTSGTMKKFGRTAWRFQATFQTSLKSLDSFVGAILSLEPAIERGTMTVDATAFDPEPLRRLIPDAPPSLLIARDFCFEAEGGAEVHALLVAAFASWTDFSFVPTPKPFVIYADHDEYATFYANSRGCISRISDALTKAGVRQALDYRREI